MNCKLIDCEHREFYLDCSRVPRTIPASKCIQKPSRHIVQNLISLIELKGSRGNQYSQDVQRQAVETIGRLARK